MRIQYPSFSFCSAVIAVIHSSYHHPHYPTVTTQRRYEQQLNWLKPMRNSLSRMGRPYVPSEDSSMCGSLVATALNLKKTTPHANYESYYGSMHSYMIFMSQVFVMIGRNQRNVDST